VHLPLPPLAEQRRIVEAIEQQLTRLDAGVASLKRTQAGLRRYKAAVLKAACEGRLVAQDAGDEPADALLRRILDERRAKWEADIRAKGKDPRKTKYEEPLALDVVELPELPKTWQWVKLGQLAWSVKDGPHFSPQYVESGIPFVSGGNVRPSGVDFTSTKFISLELHAELSKRCKPEKGDILYTKGGTTGIARVNTYDREFNVWVHVAILKLADSVDRFYLQHALNSPFCYAQAQRFTHGVGNQDLGLTRMVNIVLPLPPLAEQQRIVAEVERRLSVVAEVEAALAANLKRAERLRQSILKRAFEGKLVPQDPSDEPASVLLERIRREREGQGGKKDVKQARMEGM
jgi:type I restriction enzyme, S subunit